MSLSAILLKNKAEKIVDEGLDDIFKSSAGPSFLVKPSTQAGPSTASQEEDSQTARQKRKPSEQPVTHSPKKKSRLNEASVESPSLKGKGKVVERESEAETEDEAEKEESDEDGEDTIPVHESLSKEKGKRKESSSKVKKYVPPDETKEMRDARTLFVGNVPAQLVKSKPLQKQLKRHIISFVPSAKIESIRFRSIPVKNPVTKLEDDEGKSTKASGRDDLSTKQNRQAKRAAEWRSSKDEDEADLEKVDGKKYLTPQQKRRLAFIKGEVNEHADTVLAYVVFAHPIPKELLSTNVPHKEVMNPYQAVKEAVTKCDGSVFMEHTLRTDFVGKEAKIQAVLEASEDRSQVLSDPKLTVFVGNLDFESKEEDVRIFFETLLREERGPPPGGDGNEDGEDSRPKRWVTRVRVVRDKDTQLGKGFAYVQFADHECVDEILALDEAKLKFAKRKLRVQRCKTAASTSGKSTAPKLAQQSKTQASEKGARGAVRPKAAPSTAITTKVPKGDPSLGTKLAGLPKEVRKQLKATDADRVARRLAKKKARHALEKAAAKEKTDLKPLLKGRKSNKQKSINPGRKESKGRVRSDRMVAKKNVKKQ